MQNYLVIKTNDIMYCYCFLTCIPGIYVFLFRCENFSPVMTILLLPEFCSSDDYFILVSKFFSPVVGIFLSLLEFFSRSENASLVDYTSFSLVNHAKHALNRLCLLYCCRQDLFNLQPVFYQSTFFTPWDFFRG